jgi:hypothetical protein
MDRPGILLQRFLFYRPTWMIWLFRIIFSLNILIPCLVFEDHYYPAMVLLGSLLAYWLDVGKLTWLGLLILGLMTAINYNHLFYPIVRE